MDRSSDVVSWADLLALVRSVLARTLVGELVLGLGLASLELEQCLAVELEEQVELFHIRIDLEPCRSGPCSIPSPGSIAEAGLCRIQHMMSDDHKDSPWFRKTFV